MIAILYVVVEVDKLQTEIASKGLTKSGLASCHEADE